VDVLPIVEVNVGCGNDGREQQQYMLETLMNTISICQFVYNYTLTGNIIKMCSEEKYYALCQPNNIVLMVPLFIPTALLCACHLMIIYGDPGYIYLSFKRGRGLAR
jgi:hypothetical protein